MAWYQRLDGYERPLGDSELPLFLGSQNALGDMFLFLAFKSPSRYLRAERVEIAWSIIRRNNPLLMCKVLADEDNPRLSFSPPPTTEAVLKEAASALHWSQANRDELISGYMDGPRRLSNDYLSYLIISEQGKDEWNLLMCAPHFIGDGTALHQSTHELLTLLSSEKTDAELLEQLNTPKIWMHVLPPSVESRLSVPRSRFARAACKINYLQALSKEIGGHTLSRIQRGPKRTVMEEREFTEEQTAAILSRCKANGVTINHALVALCNIAWTRCTSESPELPMMLYTAANLRSHLAPHPSDSHWFLALTYFTISLPAFPGNIWYRARQAKAQMQGAVRSPLLPARALLSAASRARRDASSDSACVPPAAGSPKLPTRPSPSAALLGVSFIGDLDRTYVRTAYGPGLHLHTVATASRLKPGGILLLGHSFGQRLVVQLCWDSMGFTAGQIERFWAAFTAAIPEFLVC